VTNTECFFSFTDLSFFKNGSSVWFTEKRSLKEVNEIHKVESSIRSTD